MMTSKSFPVDQASTLPAKTHIRTTHTNVRQKHRPRQLVCLSFQSLLYNSKVTENAEAASLNLPNKAVLAATAAAAAALTLGHPPLATAQYACAPEEVPRHDSSSPHVPATEHSLPQGPNPTASVAGLFGLGEDDGDTAGPFAIQGLTRKKYIIERKEGEKVVARKQGITTNTCLTARPLAGEPSSSADSQTCRQAEKRTVEQACGSSCQDACKSSISEFTEARQKFSGFVSQPEEREKITRACTRRCVYECKKPADGYVFEVNTRR